MLLDRGDRRVQVIEGSDQHIGSHAALGERVDQPIHDRGGGTRIALLGQVVGKPVDVVVVVDVAQRLG